MALSDDFVAAAAAPRPPGDIRIRQVEVVNVVRSPGQAPIARSSTNAPTNAPVDIRARERVGGRRLAFVEVEAAVVAHAVMRREGPVRSDAWAGSVKGTTVVACVKPQARAAKASRAGVAPEV